MIEDIVGTPRIYATLDGQQVDHQATMVEIEGKILNTSISILIDPDACWSYVSPKIVYICKLEKLKHDKHWLVQLATSTKWNVSEIVKYYEVSLNGFPTKVNRNILPLGSYDIIIGMDWLEQYHVMLNCLQKSILCTDIQGNQVKIQGIPKKVLVRQIYTLQGKKCIRKDASCLQ